MYATVVVKKIQLKMNYTFVRPKADGWPA